MYKTLCVAILLLSVVLSVVFSPDLALQASLSGVTIWWKLVFPGLLPFLIIYEIMLAFGLIHGIQGILAPLASRLMKLPKAATFPFVMSLIGGSPIGVEPTIKLLENKTLTTSQAQRLLAYAHLPNPIIVIVIVGTGFLVMPAAGLIMLITIWVTTILLIFIQNLFQSRKEPTISSVAIDKRLGFIASMEYGRRLDGRTFGKVLGDSVSSSVQKLFIIGGFIIFSSVLAGLASAWLQPITDQLPFLIQALLELHIGSYAIASWTLSSSALPLGIAFIVACLSFGGVSGLLQVSYYTAGTSLRVLPLLLYRIIHALSAFAMTLLMWKPLNTLFDQWLHMDDRAVFQYMYEQPITIYANDLPYIWKESLLLSGALVLFSLVVTVLNSKRQQTIKK